MFFWHVIAIKVTHYYLCCHDGNYHHNSSERITEQRDYIKSSHKINVELKYITAHTNHLLGVVQLSYLALPKTIRGEVAIKISKGIQAERILEGMSSISKF